MVAFFIDKDDGEVYIDFYLPEWLRRLLWPDRSFDPEDAEVYKTVIEQYIQATMKLAAVRLIDYQFTVPMNYINSKGQTYGMMQYEEDALFVPAPPMGPE